MEEEVFDWLREADEADEGIARDAEFALAEKGDSADEGSEIEDYDEDGAEHEPKEEEEDRDK